MGLLCLVGGASATSIFVEGTITDVKPDRSGYTVIGYDHYNHARYMDKITNIQVKIAGNCVFVLDNRILKRDLVLARDRHAYAIGSSAGAMLVVTLSEPADRVIGEVLGSEAGQLKLGIGIGADSYETAVPADAQAAYRDGGKDASRNAVAAAGKSVRILPARKQTVLAYSPAAFADAVPPKTPLAICGVIKSMEGGNWALTAPKEEGVEEIKPQAKKVPVVFDVRGFVGHGDTPLAGIGPGAPAVFIGFEKRPGKIDYYLVLQAPDEGRTEGVVKALSGGTLTLSVLAPGGWKEATVKLESDAVCTLDGKAASPAEALKAGHTVSVFASRKQIVEAMAAPASAAAGH
jgi:hypothetical protein